MLKWPVFVLVLNALLLSSYKGTEGGAVYFAQADSVIVKKDTVPPPRTKIDTIIDFAKDFVGTRYCYGSCSPQNGFDCSGFIYYVFLQNGITIPRSSYEMGRFGKQVKLSECRKGDIILFRGTNASNPRIGHAALVISEQGQPVTFIHSSSNKKKGGVIISQYDESPYYAKRFVKVIRVL